MPAPSPGDSVAAKAALGARVRELRLAKALPLAGLAELSGMSLSHIADIEHGRTLPSLATLPLLAKGLGIASTELLAGLGIWD